MLFFYNGLPAGKKRLFRFPPPAPEFCLPSPGQSQSLVGIILGEIENVKEVNGSALKLHKEAAAALFLCFDSDDAVIIDPVWSRKKSIFHHRVLANTGTVFIPVHYRCGKLLVLTG
jgi:hypothetical protein